MRTTAQRFVFTSAALLACYEPGAPLDPAPLESSCVEGTSECRASGHAALCGGGKWTERACERGCFEGRCAECSEGERRCSDASTAQSCERGRMTAADCGAAACNEGYCGCPPNPTRCTDAGRERCEGAGVWSADACPADLPICQQGDCLRCMPGSAICLNDSTSQVCSANGLSEGAVACPNGCDETSGQCLEYCSPDAVRCRPGRIIVERCASDGSGYQTIDRCDEDTGEVCVEGECRRSCEIAAENLAPSGCSFHAPPVPFIDQDYQLPSTPRGAAGRATRFHVLNPDPVFAARVTVHQAGIELAQLNVLPGSFQTADVPAPRVSPIESTRMSDAAVTIVSNRAVFVVHHLDLHGFMAPQGENSVSGDTAFLLPDHLMPGYGTRYRVITQPVCLTHGYVRPGGFTLVALSAEPTHIRMTLTAATAPGPAGDPRPYAPGIPEELDLEPGDVIHFRAQGGGCEHGTCSAEDLSGSLLESTDGRPFAVFNGGVSRVPCLTGFHSQNQLLEQLMPVSLWGGGPDDAHVTAARQMPQAQEEWVVVTDEELNELRFSPPPPSAADRWVLTAPGDKLRFNTAIGAFIGYRTFKLESTKPILVGRYYYVENLSSSSTFTLERPLRFWRSEYHVASVGASANRLLLVVPEAENVALDGTAVDAPATAGPPGYQVLDVEVAKGAHRLSSSVPFGVLVYGHLPGSVADAYSYMGPVGFADAL